MPIKDRAYYLNAAEALLSSASFTKDVEGKFRSLIRLAEIPGGSRKSSIPTEFRQWLSTGSGWSPEQRDMGTGTGSYPGGTGVPTPLEFQASVFQSLRAVDDLWDPDVVSLYETPRGTSWAVPCADDSQIEGVPIGEGVQSTKQDIALGQLSLPKATTYRSEGLIISRELLQDSAINIAELLAAIFAIRFQRRIGRTVLIPLLLASAPVARTATGATAASQAPGDGTNSVSTDDLGYTAGQLDESYSAEGSWLMNRRTFEAINYLRTSTGALVFDDPDAEQPTLRGRAVRLCPSMPDLGHSNVPILLGALKRLAIRVVVGGVSILRSDQLYASTDQIYFEGYLRANAGIAFASSNPSTPSPFIAIANA
jgi:HK97 family phage major capsid protein